MPTSQILLNNHVTQGQDDKETTINEATDALERKICNQSTIDISSLPAIITLTDDQVRDMSIVLNGAIAENKTIEAPPRNMLYLIENFTTGAFTVTFEVVGGGGASVLLGRTQKFWIWCNGVDCFDLTRRLLDYVQNVSTTYQILSYDRVVNCDTSGGAFTVTLPQVFPGKRLTIQSVGGTNTLTIAPSGANFINGSVLTKTITTQWQSIELIGESLTNWVASRKTVA